MRCIQAALPCLLAVPPGARSELTLRGGTDAAMAPPVWYTQHVLLPLLRTWWGLDADLQVPHVLATYNNAPSCLVALHGGGSRPPCFILRRIELGGFYD